MTHQSRETEIKLKVGDAGEARQLLLGSGFRETRARAFESNTIFDGPGLPLRTGRELLRVRTAGELFTLTFKGPSEHGKYKTREELELKISSAETMNAILRRLGFEPVFRYEKYRTEFRDGNGAAVLDETPLGVYLELEGSPEWIDAAAARLGFGERDYITASYARLYFDHCERAGLKPAHMVFTEDAAP
jgi:adenylate cyclase class 2